MKHILLLSVTLLIGSLALGQGAQSEYLEAKRLFDEGKYTSSKGAFGALVATPDFAKYSLFYYGLSAYKQGDGKSARDSWKQLVQQEPDWEQVPEVLFWLSYSSLEDTLYTQGIKYAQDLTEKSRNFSQEESLIRKFISPLPIKRVDSLVKEFPEHRLLANLLVKKLSKVSYQKRDFVRINALIEKWEFEVDDFAMVELPLVKKDTYNIAVLLPFLFQSLENTSLIAQNTLVMDMYQGMQLAAKDLSEIGMPVNLFPYDTKRQVEETEKILQSPGFKSTDLIIGPLYPGPNTVVNAFTKENAINTFNPISSNVEVIGDNPYSFLVRPTNATLALKTAELAIQENAFNPYTMIFYEQSDRDSLFAAVYKQKVEEAGFKVVLYQPITKDNAKTLLDTLSAQYYAYYSQEEADSLIEAGEYVRDRRIRRDEMDRMKRDQRFVLPISFDDNQNEIVFYQQKFYMAPDSIGHIVAATRSNLFANNMISVIESRGDSTKLYGSGDWLDFTMLSFNQLDRLGVGLSDPDYLNRDSFAFKGLKQRIGQEFKTNPSINHYRGYEIVWFTGRMLHRNGKYFQRGIRSGDFYPGKIFEGHQYGVANDNQIVPIVRFKNAKLEVVNREQYEDRKE
ncbi:MAG: hypothetical protein RIC35_18410 [Marinoscillum sp.]